MCIHISLVNLCVYMYIPIHVSIYIPICFFAVMFIFRLPIIIYVLIAFSGDNYVHIYTTVEICIHIHTHIYSDTDKHIRICNRACVSVYVYTHS